MNTKTRSVNLIEFFINDLSRLNWRSLFNKKPPAMRVGNIGYTEITFPVS